MIYPKSQSRYIKWQFSVVNPGKPDPKGLGLPVAQLLSLLNPTHAPPLLPGADTSVVPTAHKPVFKSSLLLLVSSLKPTLVGPGPMAGRAKLLSPLQHQAYLL